MGTPSPQEKVAVPGQELKAALEQQAATSAILRAIAASPSDIQPVLKAVAESAAKLCDAFDAAIFLRHGESLAIGAHHGPIPIDFDAWPIGRDWVTGRAVADRTPVHIHDLLAQSDEFPIGAAMSLRLGHRTILAIPLLREGDAIGALVIRRTEVRPFSAKQIDLLKTFGDQAVIAIQNARLFDEVQARSREIEARGRELDEALRQQTATADVLKVISRSAFDLDIVLTTLISTAIELCDATRGVIWLKKGERLLLAAQVGYPDEWIAFAKNNPITPAAEAVTTSGLAAFTGEVVSVEDILSDPRFRLLDAHKLGGYRAGLAVPLKRAGKVEGVISLSRPLPQAFSERQVALVQTFADQAVIAIENVRLFEEAQKRSAELSEALHQQTATAEVLKVISRSAFDLEAVLHTLIESAARLCDADKGAITRQIDGVFYRAEAYGFSAEFAEYLRTIPVERDDGSAQGRVLREGKVVHIVDVEADPSYTFEEAKQRGGFRTILGVPMMRDGVAIGSMGLARSEVRPFTDKQIELVTTFADQAVIAIENARLFEEVQARNREIEARSQELGEALRQQTATADVLKVISRSAFDLEAVLHTLVESAARLCDAEKATITRQIGGTFYRAEAHGFSPEFIDYVRAIPVQPERGSVTGRALLEGKVIHIADVQTDPEYTFAEAQRLDGFRTILGVPMLREGAPIGVMALTRSEVRPFTDRQIELVSTLADQAAIAIENVRLFEEVKARTAELSEALQQQTATAEVLQAISRSTFDLETVLNTLVDSAARLCGANVTQIFRWDGAVLRWAAGFALNPAYLTIQTGRVYGLGRDSLVGRAAMEKRTVLILDALADPEYAYKDHAKIGNIRTMLGVPLLRSGELIGVIALARDHVEAFGEKQIEIVTTFADQAVIAIENARLFAAVKHRTEELSRSLEELRTAQDRLIQTEKLASLGQLTAGIAHEIKNPLNFINNFSAVSVELIEELRGLLNGADADRRRSAIDELMTMLEGNLEKVVQHGKRADSIVKNMLLHSRQGSGEHRPVNINSIVEESLNLAYHGARAEKQGFNITLEKSLDPEAGEVDLFPQEITRVLLNLISNGFYATAKRRAEANGAAYEPTLSATTRNLGDRVEVRIRDNGTGIPAEVRDKMFTPFFTTKPAGEGTGLGLSLSHDIIVKQHAGSIAVDTEPGEYTEFRIVLPRAAASIAGSGGAA